MQAGGGWKACWLVTKTRLDASKAREGKWHRVTQSAKADTVPNIDTESFRLSAFIELLKREGELELVQTPTDLIDVAARLDGNSKAVLFEKAGPEQARLVGNVMGSRRRMALAFGVSEKDAVDRSTSTECCAHPTGSDPEQRCPCSSDCTARRQS